MKQASVIVLLSLVAGLSAPLNVHKAAVSDKNAHCITTLDVCGRAHAGVSVNDDAPFLSCAGCKPAELPKAPAGEIHGPAFRLLLLVLEKDRPPKA